MKIAIISDIHANYEAIKETLKDIKKRNVDKIMCLGDIIAKGTHPNKCIELVKKNCDVVLRGNCDRHFSSKHEDITTYPEYEQKRIKYNQSLLSEEERKYLLNLPFSHEFYLSGSLIRLFHATPTADNKTVINLDKIQTK